MMDDFERYLKRGYTGDLCDEFDRRKVFYTKTQNINLTKEVRNNCENLYKFMNESNEVSKKLKSVFRLYFEIFSLHNNTNISVITLATNLETLLLGKNEDNQRKKVAVRAACLICNGLECKREEFVANLVYYFYRYRNGIIHDGLSYLDFEDEVTMDHILWSMKHVIFGVIYSIVQNNIVDINSIKLIVKNNLNMDKKTNAFEYITNLGDSIQLHGDF